MAQNPQSVPPFFHIDVSASNAESKNASAGWASAEAVGLLRQIAANQERQNQLLQELIQQVSAHQRQKAAELAQWRQANPELARECRAAAQALNEVQTEFLRNLTEEIQDTREHLVDGEFMLNEFVDRYGPRLVHLNGVLQVLSQLSAQPPGDSASG